MEKVNLRNCFFGGYKKADVINCLKKIECEYEKLKKQTADEVLAATKRYNELEDKYQQTILLNENLKKKCNEFYENKNILVQLEINANARATKKLEETEKYVQQKLEDTQKKANQIVYSAKTEAKNIREQYILKAKNDMLLIQKLQTQIEGLTSSIVKKNDDIQEQMNALEKIIGVNYER